MSNPEMNNQPGDNPEATGSDPTVSAETTTSPSQAIISDQQQVAPTPHRAPVAPRAPYVSREERERRRREALSGLVVGEWREGKVTGIAGFGAFVDLGGVDGLVHVSQLGTGGYVERVEDVVQVGQVVRVRVAEVDMDRGRVSLSMREPRATTSVQRDRPTSPTSPRPPRPMGSPGQTPAWTPESTPEQQRPERRFRGGDQTFANKNEERPIRRGGEKTRRGRDSADEEWRSVRGDPRNYYSYSEDAEEEPAPTTAEELVARFGRKDSSK